IMRYLIRAVKYFFAFCVLYVGVVWLSILTQKSMDISVWDSISATMATERGRMLALAVVALSAAYPFFGFVKRSVKWNMTTDADRLVEIFAAAGFALKEQGEGKMVFKANNILDRLVMLFEDEIVVEQQGEQITLDGIRRGVAKVIYRLN
ncbi:MAG: hypothetical protein J6U52_07340, partial [Alistipes sp.]|nr:hypothetical protein [Alistipes sp.]